MIYLELLWSFFQIGLFSIGGPTMALYYLAATHPESGSGYPSVADNDTVCRYYDDR